MDETYSTYVGDECFDTHTMMMILIMILLIILTMILMILVGRKNCQAVFFQFSKTIVFFVFFQFSHRNVSGESWKKLQ